MSQRDSGDHRYSISALCGLFGISRQGYYKHSVVDEEVDILISSIVLYCQDIRRELPRSGARQLYALCLEYFGDKFTLGRDRFYEILRANDLMLRKKRKKPKTTNSNHPYKIYSDLLNTSPKYIAKDHCRLIVGDITYVRTAEDFAYLSLLTDAYSRIIVGYALHRTLKSKGPMRAFEMASQFYKSYNLDLKGLIHHSDRGVQYASKAYVSTLLSKGIRISMTQVGDPLHNALAERMNNTIKNGWLYNYADKTFEETEEAVKEAIYRYNWMRPHQALGMKTPMQMMPGVHPNPLIVGRGHAHDQLLATMETKKKTEHLFVNLNRFNFVHCKPI